MHDAPLVMSDEFPHQFPRTCSGQITLLHDDLRGAGLGWTAKMIVFALVEVNREGRTLLEAHSSGRWCSRAPGTLQCYYHPWTNCSLADAHDVRNMSLRDFWANRKWYGMSMSTASLQPHAFKILFRPRPSVMVHVEWLARQCGGTDYWTVHYRDSPEKRKERGRLPPFEAYIRQLPSTAKRVLWQTSNPQGFQKMMDYTRTLSLPYCHTNFTRHSNDVWGGRDARYRDESGLTGAVNGEAARRGVGCVSTSTSSWNWFITVGTGQQLIAVA